MLKKQQIANTATAVDSPRTEDAKTNATEAPSPVSRDHKTTHSRSSSQQQRHTQRARTVVVDRVHYLS